MPSHVMRADPPAALAGKVAVITGSTAGPGLAIARVFADAGAAVVISSHLPNEVARAVAWRRERGATVAGHPCDVRELVQVAALAEVAVATFGPPDVRVTAVHGPTAAVPPPRGSRGAAPLRPYGWGAPPLWKPQSPRLCRAIAAGLHALYQFHLNTPQAGFRQSASEPLAR